MNTVEENNIQAVTEVVETPGVDSQVHVEKTTTESGQEISLAAEPIGHIGNFNITNSLLNTWLVVFIILAFAIVLRKKIKLVPRGLQNAFEIIMEGAMDMADSVTGDRKKTLKIFPIVFALFIFIFINNWLGLFPGIGSIGFNEVAEGKTLFIPYFRGGMADLNTTLALALISVVISNIFGIFFVGIWKYFNKFINIKVLAEIPKHIIKEPSVIIVNPIKFFVGIIEIVSEIAKVASLSFRLFGNDFAGEVLLSSIAVIFAFGLPIPFMFLEVLVGVIQALIFAMLTTVYFSIAMTAEEH